MTIHCQEKLKVCFILGMFHPVINGAIIQISLLAERLAKKGISVMVVTTKLFPQQPYCEMFNGIKVIRTGPAFGVKRIGKYIKLIPVFIALIRERNNYDLVVVCDFAVRGVLGVIVSKIFRKKCLLRAESNGEMDGSYATQYSLQTSKLKLMMIRIIVNLRNVILKRANGYISISSDITKELLGSGVNRNKVNEITNGVDVKRFRPLDQKRKAVLKEKIGFPNKKYFIYTGRLARGKGLEYLLNVWMKLVAEFNDIHLFLIGSGQGYSLSCEDELKTFVNNNHLETSVTFTGNVRNVSEYLQAGDFYVLPSQSEGLSISLIEALSCGLPCIGTSVRGILDVVEDNVNGLLVPYGNEDKLYHAMKELLTNSGKAARLGRKGEKTVLDKFNIDTVAEQYLKFFEKLYSRQEQFNQKQYVQ
jgi:glycosyltransferase involved in cell wall biosynthesis